MRFEQSNTMVADGIFLMKSEKRWVYIAVGEGELEGKVVRQLWINDFRPLDEDPRL